MGAKRLPAKDDSGWPYCIWCRRNGVLVVARSDERDPTKPGFDTCCPDHHRVWTDDQRLTWEEFRAGEACRGCGEPFIDAVPWSGSGKGTMPYTDTESAKAEAEEERYRAKHPDCHSMRHRVSGSLTTHCARCCPPPPLSPEQIERLSAILLSVRSAPPLPAAVAVPKPLTRRQLERRIVELEDDVSRLQKRAEVPS